MPHFALDESSKMPSTNNFLIFDSISLTHSREVQMMHSKKNRFVLTIVALTLFFTKGSMSLFAQSEIVVLLKGTIKEQVSGTPVEAEISFRDEADSPVRAKSDKQGNYQAVLKPGQKYTVIFTGQNILREIMQFSLDPVDKYTEIRKDFSVRKVVEGAELFNGFAFQKGSTSLTDEGQNKIKEIIDILNKNRSMTIKISVFGDMPDDPSLQQPRIDALTTALSEVKSGKKRISFISTLPFPKREEAAPVPPPPAPDPKEKKKKKNTPPPPPPAPLPPIIIPLANCIIIVGESQKLFD